MKEVRLNGKQQQELFLYIVERIGDKNARQVKEVCGANPIDFNKLEALSKIKVEELYNFVKTL
jgi:hypothetical protein